MRKRRQIRFMIINRETITITLSAVVVAVTFFLLPGRNLQEGIGGLYDAVPAATMVTQNLKNELAKVQRDYNVPPSDAKFDRWWKLIPGVNGVQLNIDKTLLHATADPATTMLYFKQIPARITASSFGAAPIYRGNEQKQQMALMFNVAWGTEYVPQILRILQDNHVRATFFLDGSWTAKNPEIARQIAQAGMEIGNHAYNHPLMSRISRQRMISQITRTNQTIFQATKVQPQLFAPPAGDYNQLVVDVAAGLKMQTILWTLDTVDWKKPSPSVILSRIVSKKTPGALVLMHPTKPTVQALSTMIRELQQAHFQLVTVSELLSPVRPTPKTLQDALRAKGHS